MNLQLRTHESLPHSAAFSLFLRAYAELLDNDQTPTGTPWDYNTQVVYFEDVDAHKIVSLLAFHINRQASQLWLLFNYTVPEHRRTGLYKQLHAHVETRARALGLRSLAGNIHASNVPSLEAARVLGHTVEFCRIIKPLR